MDQLLEKAIKKLDKKHLLIIGADEGERSKFVNLILEQTYYETFRFPKGMKTIYDYVDFVRARNLYTPWYTKKGKFGTNQLLDFHRDWISDNHSLVILEEIDQWEENWKIDLLKSYLNEVVTRQKGQKVIHLIVSQESEHNLLQKLEEEFCLAEEEGRTKQQVIEGCFEIIELNEYALY